MPGARRRAAGPSRPPQRPRAWARAVERRKEGCRPSEAGGRAPKGGLHRCAARAPTTALLACARETRATRLGSRRTARSRARSLPFPDGGWCPTVSRPPGKEGRSVLGGAGVWVAPPAGAAGVWCGCVCGVCVCGRGGRLGPASLGGVWGVGSVGGSRPSWLLPGVRLRSRDLGHVARFPRGVAGRAGLERAQRRTLLPPNGTNTEGGGASRHGICVGAAAVRRGWRHGDARQRARHRAGGPHPGGGRALGGWPTVRRGSASARAMARVELARG